VIRWIIFIGNLFFFQCATYAQSVNIKLGISAAYLLPHHADMSHLYSHAYLYSLDCVLPIVDSYNTTITKRSIGVNATFYDINNEILGKGIAVGINYQNRLYAFSNNSRLEMKLTLGLGYLTNKYSYSLNPWNNAIGSNFNGSMKASVSLQKQLSSDFFYSFDIGLAHFSNAAFRMPNLGINLPFFEVAIGKSLKYKKTLVQPRIDYGISRNWSQHLAVKLAGKTNNIDDDRLFIFPNIDYGMYYKYNSNSHLRFVTSINFDPIYRYQKFVSLQNPNFSNVFENGISIGYQTFFNRFGLILDFGLYTYKPIKKLKSSYYERIGISYHVTKAVDFQLLLKANKTTADYSEFGFTYRFY
jgi:hypothetical protein